MKPTKIFAIPNGNKHYFKTTQNPCYYSSVNFIKYEKAYMFDFPMTKRTILYDNQYKLIQIPNYSVIIFKYNPTFILIGHHNKELNRLEGMEVNGNQPWACGIFEKQNNNPENDIKDVMNLYWNSTFPYYNNFIKKIINKLGVSYVDLNLFKQLT